MIKRGALLGQARCPGQRPASRCRRGVGKAGDSNREGDVGPRQPAAQGPAGKYVTPLGPSRVPAAEPPTLPTQHRPWRPLCAVQTGAPRLAGDARGALAPGKLLALCWCHWPHLLVPHRTPAGASPTAPCELAGCGRPAPPEHSPLALGAAVASCSWAHSARTPTSRMPTVLMVLPAGAGRLARVGGGLYPRGAGEGLPHT